ncbi:MAG: replicative DNA helicase [Planctomycetes bacterium]|nr:replicative DNA helicase [Planctomycetota bacterium]
MDPTVAKNHPADTESFLADRKLPQTIEAEQCVLGAVLLDPSIAPGILQLLTIHDFFSPRHQKIFTAVQTIYDQLSTVDPVLVRDELERLGLAAEVGGMEYLEEIMGVVSTVANAEFHARNVREKAILRHLIATCTEIIRNAYESEESPIVQLDAAEESILEIGSSGRTDDFVEIQKVIDAHFEQLELRKGHLEGLSTGFKDLDAITTGLHPAEFIIVAGRPSMGKTSFAMNVVETVALAGKTVAIFSLEVNREQLVQNLLCSFARVDAQKFRKGDLNVEAWQAIVTSAHRLRELKIYIMDAPNHTPLALKSKARRLFDRRKFDLMVIDYLQLMETSDNTESRQQEVAKISRSLKALARELNIPIIAISQLSRGVENRESHRPRLSDLRESGAIEQDADLVLLLYREEYYYPEKEEAKGMAEVMVAKQRNGPTGSAHLQFQSQYMRFQDLDYSSLHPRDDAASPQGRSGGVSYGPQGRSGGVSYGPQGRSGGVSYGPQGRDGRSESWPREVDYPESREPYDFPPRSPQGDG